MQQTRQYGHDETPALGDVVRLCGGPYGAAVVTSIPTNDDVAVCERVHASVSASGQIQLGVERITVTVADLRGMAVFVTGPSGQIDNRVRGV